MSEKECVSEREEEWQEEARERQREIDTERESDKECVRERENGKSEMRMKNNTEEYHAPKALEAKTRKNTYFSSRSQREVKWHRDRGRKIIRRNRIDMKQIRLCRIYFNFDSRIEGKKKEEPCREKRNRSKHEALSSTHMRKTCFYRIRFVCTVQSVLYTLIWMHFLVYVEALANGMSYMLGYTIINECMLMRYI